MMISGRRVSVALATIVNAAQVLLLQLLALVSLAPADFGAYSLQYLGFALASSLSLSLIVETWMRLRTGASASEQPTWRQFSTTLVYFSLSAGFVALVLSLLLPSLREIAIFGAIAIAASTYRAGSRYHELVSGHLHRVLVSDLSGLLATGGVWLTFTIATSQSSLLTLVIAWAAGSVLSAAIARIPLMGGPRIARRWVLDHSATIKPLLRDSSLMDLGAIGTPFIVAPVLGIASFGVYRAVSNVAAPVRLVLNPIRPLLASRPASFARSKSVVLGAAGASASFGIASFFCLWLIGQLQLNLGVLTDVASYSVPTAIFVAASFLGHFFYIAARSHANSRSLMTGRIVQTALAVLLPIAGALLGGLQLAIWGYAIATAISSATWTALILRAPRELE